MLADAPSTHRRPAARPIHIAILGSLLFSSGFMLPAVAQDEPAGDSGKPSIRTIVEKNAPDRSGQFLSQDDPGQTTTLIVEEAITIKMPGVQAPATSCKATVTISYAQLNTIADVESIIENADCAASGGNYTAIVSIRDASGEASTLEFEES